MIVEETFNIVQVTEETIGVLRINEFVPPSKGDKGEKGDRGDKGDKGDKGDMGETGTILSDLVVFFENKLL